MTPSSASEASRCASRAVVLPPTFARASVYARSGQVARLPRACNNANALHHPISAPAAPPTELRGTSQLAPARSPTQSGAARRPCARRCISRTATTPRATHAGGLGSAARSGPGVPGAAVGAVGRRRRARGFARRLTRRLTTNCSARRRLFSLVPLCLAPPFMETNLRGAAGSAPAPCASHSGSGSVDELRDGFMPAAARPGSFLLLLLVQGTPEPELSHSVSGPEHTAKADRKCHVTLGRCSPRHPAPRNCS